MATSQVAATTVAPTEKRSTAKLDTIRNIEKQMQKIWSDLKVFEADAPGHPTDQ